MSFVFSPEYSAVDQQTNGTCFLPSLFGEKIVILTALRIPP